MHKYCTIVPGICHLKVLYPSDCRSLEVYSAQLLYLDRWSTVSSGMNDFIVQDEDAMVS
jgi:hypothetical protein